MSDFTPIDHKEKSQSDRAAVLKWVQGTIGFEGCKPSDASDFSGEWRSRFARLSTEQGPWFAIKSLKQNGSVRSTAVDGSFESDKDRWAFNSDGSFSYWSYCDAMPEYGMSEPTMTEDRYHALFNGNDVFVLFNGDGSLIELHERKEL
jgi:hypothetical protein